MDQAIEWRVSERQRRAERWRVVGEMLLEISPETFEKLLAMFAASAVIIDQDDEIDISQAYTAH